MSITEQPPVPPSPQSAPLDYGRAAPKARKWIVRGIALSLIMLLGFASWRWGPSAWTRVQLLYWQRQCLRYTASPDKVVYEEEPAAAAKLRATSSQYTRWPLNRSMPPQSAPEVIAGAHQPLCWQRINPQLPGRMMMAGFHSGGAILFLHERISPAGHRRLVSLRYYAESVLFTGKFYFGFNYDWQVVTPATWSAPPLLKVLPYNYSVPSQAPRHPPMVRVYAGQPDPADPSHFTIRYQMWAQNDILDGYLDDNDNITLKPRNPPKER